ncbi:hypothetical protein PSY31_23490, partial [Shigella flexneri]|nr:hypothetical protein [Shigella flexneri]
QVARQRQTTHKLKSATDEWVDTPEGVANLLVDHFKAMLTMPNTQRDDDLLQNIPKLITSHMNQELTKWPEIEETQQAVFSMDKD